MSLMLFFEVFRSSLFISESCRSSESILLITHCIDNKRSQSERKNVHLETFQSIMKAIFICLIAQARTINPTEQTYRKLTLGIKNGKTVPG